MKRFISFCMLLLTLYLGHAQQGLQVSVSTTSACNNDGTATATVVGGTAPYTYSWVSNGNPVGGNSPVVNNLAATNWWNGNLMVYVTDINGVQGQGWGTVSEVVSVQMDSGVYVLCPATSTGVSVNVLSGTAPYSYQWSNGATTASIVGSVGTVYTVDVTDVNGCVGHSAGQGQSTEVFSVTNMQISLTSTPANCINGTATATIISQGNTVAPYTYSWSNGQTGATANNLIAYQMYSVVVTDAQGCITNQSVYISSASNLWATITTTPENCNNLNGTATTSISGGTPPYTYSWSTGQNTQNLTNAANGYHEVWVTDANSCVAYQSAFISEVNPLAIAISSMPSACTPPSGTSTITVGGGLAPYTYYWNTNPPQTTPTATNLPAGNHSIMVTDANGCQYQTNVLIGSTSTLDFSITEQDETCDLQDGSASVNILSGVAPYTYSWSNGQTISTASNLMNGVVSVQVTDANGCQLTKWVNIDETTPLSISYSAIPATCLYNADGSLTANVMGAGTPPYTYNWWGYASYNTGGGIITGSQPTLSNLYEGSYGIYITDANGCDVSQVIGLGSSNTQPCEVFIAGKVYFDQNQDCFWNSSVEPVIQSAWVQVLPSGAMKMTNGAGEYEFSLPVGTYSVLQFPPIWAGGGTQTCPLTVPTYTLNTVGTTQVSDFADDYPIASDVSVTSVSWFNVPRPGFAYAQGIIASNLGTLNANGTITCVHPLGITFAGANPTPSSYNAATGTITWNYSQLQAFGGQYTIQVNYYVPSTMPVGTQLSFDCQISPTAGDIQPANNQYTFLPVVMASYDPNYMEVSPKGSGIEGYIPPTDSVLTYTTHFQNTGNYAATFVRLEIPLDVDLRTNSIEILAASHEGYRAEITANNMLIIYFDNINLPDSLSNPIGSCGFVTFRLHLKQGLADGTQIINHSEIIFDYNAPVITNSVKNTLKGTLSTVKPEATLFKLYPNPTQDELNLEWSEANQATTLALYNIMGLKVRTFEAEKGMTKLTASIKDLAAGVYIYKVLTNSETQQTGKVVKQ